MRSHYSMLARTITLAFLLLCVAPVGLGAGGLSGSVRAAGQAPHAAALQGARAHLVAMRSATTQRALALQATAELTATATLTISPTTFAPGDDITIQGTNFAARERITISLVAAPGSASVPLGRARADTSGNLGPMTTHVPANAPAGQVTVVASGQRSGQRAAVPATIRVPAATLRIAPTSAKPGEAISVSGTHFQPGEIVLVSFNDGVVQHLTAGASGSFTDGGFIVPKTLGAGQYRVLVVGAASGRRASAVLTVNVAPPVIAPRLSVSPSTSVPGGHVTLRGAGFVPGERVLLRLDGVLVLSVTSDRSGSFSAVLALTAALGTHTLSVTGATSSRVAAATLRVLRPVTAGIGLAPSRAHRGTVVRVNGHNFLPREVVLIRFGSTLVRATEADGSGRFANVGFSVPGSARYGATYVSGTGSRSGRSARAALQITPALAAHLTLSSTNLHRGSKVGLSATGYQPGEVVYIRFRGGLVQAATADSHGNVGKAGFRVPATSPYGTYPVTASGARSRQSATVRVRVTPMPGTGISVSPTVVQRGAIATVSGHGFAAGETVLLRVNGQLVQAAVADGRGTFGRTSFRISPRIHVGRATVLATGALSTRHAQVIVVIV